MFTKNNKNTLVIAAIVLAALLLIWAKPWVNNTPVTQSDTPEETIVTPSTSQTTIVEPITKKIEKNSSKLTTDELPPLIEKRVPVMDTHGRLIDKLDELISQYKKGSLEAGFLIALNLKKCLDTPATPEEIEKLITDHNHPHYDNYIAQERVSYDYCYGVDKVTRQTYYKYLQELVDKEYPPAQEHIGNVTPPFMETDEFEKLSKKEKQKYYELDRKQTNELLHKSAEGGYLVAVSHLSNNYKTGFRVEKNWVKSLTYNMVLQDLTTDSWVQDTSNKINKELRQKLTPKQINTATENSIKIINKIKLNGKIYRFP